MSEPPSPRVVYRDDDLLVLDKPTGVPTTSPDGRNCLASLARELDPDAPRMHPSSRLDAEVTGLVTFARSDRAIHGLLAARKAQRYRRLYLGLAACAPTPAEGELRWSIAPDRRDPRRRVALPEHDPAGTFALSRYQVLQTLPQATLLALIPETGRTHQLRVHAAAAGAALLGDKPYGGPTRVVLEDGRVLAARRVMLHCARVQVPAPSGAGLLLFESEVPADFAGLFSALGGAQERLSLAGIPSPP